MSQLLEISVPDIGDFDEVEVVEILVVKGDRVEFDDPLVSIESDKATMEIPSTTAGTIVELRVSEGDHVSEGSVLVVIEAEGVGGMEASEASIEEPATPDASESPLLEDTLKSTQPDELDRLDSREERAPITERELSLAAANPVPDRVGLSHASPLVRRYARELGVPLSDANGTGPRGRVLADDLKRVVRERFATDAGAGGDAGGDAGGGSGSSKFGIPAMPAVDHAAFGPVREKTLSRIQRISGPALHRSWLNIPHVTQYDEADITELDRFRRERLESASARGLKLSPLHFVMKAVVVALEEYPTFRASLAPEGDRLVIKEYFHLGIAVDTDQGLVVPVIRDVDRKGIYDLAAELAETAERARARRLGPDDLRGSVFTISSLGGIGGTAFSPIVNAPEVAVLGLSRSRVRPVWDGPLPNDAPASDSVGHFEPRLMQPLSLSYDHRVIDGAEAARFTARLSRILANPMQLLL